MKTFAFIVPLALLLPSCKESSEVLLKRITIESSHTETCRIMANEPGSASIEELKDALQYLHEVKQKARDKNIPEDEIQSALEKGRKAAQADAIAQGIIHPPAN